jgi:hypothetical protein
MRLTRSTSLSLFIALALALCGVELWVVTSPQFSPNAGIFSLVVTLDITLGLPLLYYFFVVRAYRLPRISLAAALLVSIVIAGAILPAAHQSYLGRLKLLIPLIELALLIVLLVKARQLVGEYRTARRQEIYLIDALDAGVRRTLGDYPAMSLLVTEITLVFLACFGWLISFKPTRAGQRAFSYHRTSLYPIILVVMLALMAIETVGVHLLLQKWSDLAAWIVTGLSIYSLLWIIGDFQAARLHPIVLAGDRLHLRLGLRWRVTIDIADIEGIRKPLRADEKRPDYVRFALAGTPQLVLRLKQPVVVKGLFGMRRTVSLIGVFVDQERAFREEIDAK